MIYIILAILLLYLIGLTYYVWDLKMRVVGLERRIDILKLDHEINELIQSQYQTVKEQYKILYDLYMHEHPSIDSSEQSVDCNMEEETND